MKRRYAALVPFLLLLTSSPAGATAGDLGHDVSWPQCSGTQTTTPATTRSFGVVGVTGGRPWDTNPCLQAQVTWAAGLARAPMLYTNSANPMTLSTSHWPASGRTSPAACKDRTSTTDAGCAYDYGWDAATDALTQAGALSQGSAYVRGLTWWVDVEVANSWEGDGLANAADLQGMVDRLRSAGVPDVGIYTSAGDWTAVTGSTALGRTSYTRATSSAYRTAWAPYFTARYPLEDGPLWFAGLNDQQSAVSRCATASLTGGERLLSQYADGSFDGDYRCADADRTTPTAAMTAPTSFVTMAARTTVGWKGTDVGSGVASYDVSVMKALHNAGFGPWASVGRRLLTTSLSSTSPQRGATWCWGARTRDAAGNVSGQSPSRCAVTPLDDRDLAASSGWTRTTSASGWFTGSYSTATRLGATLSRGGVQTSRLVLVAYRCPSCGSVTVLLNGTVLKTVSLASSTYGRVLVALPRFSLRTTTVTLRVATSGKPVRIDGLATSRV